MIAISSKRVNIALIFSCYFAPYAAAEQPDTTQDPYSVYGETGVVLDYADRETKLGHINLGPINDAMDAYFGFKNRLSERYGFNYTLEVAPQFQWDFEGNAGTTSNNETNLIVQWSLIDRQDPQKGNLLAWYQWANTLGSKNTSEFADKLGVISPLNGGDTAPGTAASRLQHFAWEQWFLDDSLRLMAGKLTTRVFLNLNRYATGDREDFFTPMLVNNTVVPFTARLGLGVFGQYRQDSWYLSGMVRDADASSDWLDFDSLDSGNWEYATEFGLTPQDLAGLGEGNYRFTYYYTDSIGEGSAKQPSGWTLSLSFDQDIGTRYGTVFRYAYADEDFRTFKQRLALALQVKKPLGFENDRIGFGFWWGDPTADKLEDEYGLEAFWKLQITRFLELSADLQTILDPANNPDESAVFVGGVRLRALF